jgi:hypothetical protein
MTLQDLSIADLKILCEHYSEQAERYSTNPTLYWKYKSYLEIVSKEYWHRIHQLEASFELVDKNVTLGKVIEDIGQDLKNKNNPL